MAKHKLSKEFKDRIGHPPTPSSTRAIKRAEKLARATEKGRLEGEYAGHAKKPFMESLKEHIGKWIDKIDPLELAAVLGLTVIIEPAVIKIIGAVTLTEEVMMNYLKMWAFPLLGAPELGIPEKTLKDLANTQNIGMWMLSFVIAFCIIRWGDKMIMAGIGDITKLVSLMGLLA